MTTKEQLILDLEKLPPDLIEEVYKFVQMIRTKITKKKRPLTPIHLKGRFDELGEIRKKAYE